MTSSKSAIDHELPTHYIRPTLAPSLLWSARVFAAGMLVMWGVMQVAPSFSSIPLAVASRSVTKNWPQPPLGAPIEWFKCPDSPDTYCSFVKAPLDYLDPSNNKTVSLALRKYPATVGGKRRKGSMLVNPGGPGGSGTEEIARVGKHLSEIVEGRYDIISWDPRGVNLTSPAPHCFSSENKAQLFQRDQEALGLLYENTPRSLASIPYSNRSSPISDQELAWARKLDGFNLAEDLNCVQHGDQDILQHLSTAVAARDMRFLMHSFKEEVVNYYGLSYGTILGATFAAMYPDLVGQFVLDGVSDSIEYSQNLWNWGRSAMDHTSKTLDGFLSSCAEAGPSRCAFAEPNTTLSSLHARLTALRERLHPNPLHVSPELGAGIVTTSSIQHATFRGLYNPVGWPSLAQALADAEQGNGTALYLKLNDGFDLAPHDPSDNVFGRPMDVLGSGLTCSIIECADTDPAALEDTSLETLIRYMREMGNLSISGEAWAWWIAQCRRWSVVAKDVYRGPWTREDGLRKTRNKILFVGNTADPATPLSAAIRMATSFSNDSSSLLIQDGYGHCSLAHPSLCTAKAVRAYFNDGVVPDYGTTCVSDPGFLFPAPKEVEVEVRERKEVDGRLRSALASLAVERASRKWGRVGVL